MQSFTIQEINNGWIITSGDYEDRIEIACVHDETGDRKSEVETVVETLGRLGGLVIGYDKFSEFNVDVGVKEGHKFEKKL